MKPWNYTDMRSDSSSNSKQLHETDPGSVWENTVSWSSDGTCMCMFVGLSEVCVGLFACSRLSTTNTHYLYPPPTSENNIQRGIHVNIQVLDTFGVDPVALQRPESPVWFLHHVDVKTGFPFFKWAQTRAYTVFIVSPWYLCAETANRLFWCQYFPSSFLVYLHRCFFPFH